MDARIEGGELVFGENVLRIAFQRTLRIPDDGSQYPLPPGLGLFPIRRIEDHADRVPAEWREHGGIFLPMYQREAMWLRFRGDFERPMALKIGVGKVCALTGRPWSDALHPDPQDYLVAPPQPWIDGVAVGAAEIRQFVAMPLGLGYSVEAQLTGEEIHGGLQIAAWALRPRWIRDRAGRHAVDSDEAWTFESMYSLLHRPLGLSHEVVADMGLAAGGRMRQPIHRDPHGLACWSPSPVSRVFVHLVNVEVWRDITGESPPDTPITVRSYAQAGFPWFDRYAEESTRRDPKRILGGIAGTAEIDRHRSPHPVVDDSPVAPRSARNSWRLSPNGLVPDGHW